ncbi:MAG: hypothetical protein WBF08_04325, partial [Candidatus Bathyarchaeia archaeon]
ASARRMAIGVCPKCGSENTHSCETLEHVSTSDDEKISNCQFALALDDITIGHCDVCSHIWCLECCKKISLRNLSCSCY